MKAEHPFHRGIWVVSVACVALALSGCGMGGDKPHTAGAASKSSHSSRKQTHAPNSGQVDVADMVAAVSSSKSGPPVEMKFLLPSRPEVGQAMDLEVALIPRAPVPDSVAVTFQVVDGLEILDGAQLERVDKLADGAPIRHVLKVLPKRDGIFALSAVVSYSTANQEMSRTFSIPVIAGEGLPEQIAKGP